VNAGVTNFRGCGILCELNGQAAIHRQSEIAGHLHGGGPAEFGVGAEGLALHEDDFSMAEIVKMLQGQACGHAVIEDDVGYLWKGGVAGDEDGGERKRFGELGVDGEDAFNASR